MGEIFPREAAEHPEPFTGERFTGAVGGQIQIEHYHRYLFARSLVAGRDVLDVASGEGYGAALLAQVARSVVGVEYSAPTVRTAQTAFRRPNLHFMQADARALPLATSCCDAVVSFETIEHFDRQDEYLREVRRVLRPAGQLIVSTPDRDIYSPASSPANPFHVHELTCDEFVRLLGGHFPYVQLLRQRALIGSALLQDAACAAAPQVFERRGDSHIESCIGLPRAPYLIAIASGHELPPPSPSLFVDRGDLDADRLRAAALCRELHETRAALAQARHRAGQADQAEQAFEAIRCAHAELAQQHNQLQGSLRQFLRGYWPRLRGHLLSRQRRGR